MPELRAPPSSDSMSSRSSVDPRSTSSRRTRENRPLLPRGFSETYADYKSTHSNTNINTATTDDTESVIYQTAYDWVETGRDSASSSSRTILRALDESVSSNSERPTWSATLPYYLPILSWAPHYSWRAFTGDLVGGVSLATFQIPLCLSYATSLAHVPVVSGLYSLGVAPLIYMLLGSVPQMVTGPEAPISLVVGQAVEPLLHHHKKHLEDPLELVVAITFVAGASLLGFGLGRFGFLDNVLSESLLKGFISGVGIVMIINAAIAMLGLEGLLNEVIKNPDERDIHSPFDKLAFLVTNITSVHWLTFYISFTAFVVIMGIRILKKSATSSGKHRNAVFIPEILIVVVAATWLCYYYQWDVDVIGPVKSTPSVHVYNPLSKSIWRLVKSLSTSGFMCAMLGFFESTTALKSLGSAYDLPISSNRELVALGCINLVGCLFGGLPAFGGYGRSKINAMSAKTTMSSAFMGIITLVTASWITSFLYYVPKCTLSVITGVIGISLVEEAPYELWFHWKSKGYNELLTFVVTVSTTLFFSMEAGIAVGLIYLLIRVIKHSAESRIQILGRVPGTNTFLNADMNSLATGKITTPTIMPHGQTPTGLSPEFLEKMRRKSSVHYNVFTDNNFRPLNTQVLEEIEGCLIIKIPEPLTFVNTNDLKSRLKRVEMYGSTRAHPGLKRSRDASLTKYIIFDLRGMSEIDSLAAQLMVSLLKGYRKRDIKCFFVRVINDVKVRLRLQATGINDILKQDLESVVHYKETIAPLDSELDELESLTESKEIPYFRHISDALKVIDNYDSCSIEEV